MLHMVVMCHKSLSLGFSSHPFLFIHATDLKKLCSLSFRMFHILDLSACHFMIKLFLCIW